MLSLNPQWFETDDVTPGNEYAKDRQRYIWCDILFDWVKAMEAYDHAYCLHSLGCQICGVCKPPKHEVKMS